LARELARAALGSADRSNECGADSAVFEFGESGGGGATGAGDHFAEHGGVLGGGFGEFGRAEDGLDREILGEFAGKAAGDSAIGEGLVAKRRALGLMDRTLVVGMPLECAPEAWTERAARAVMCRESEWAGNIYLGTPERQHP
jgi:hypothetical protein